MSPKLSIVIPTYNEELGIKETLEGLLSHPRLADAEIIVINDGSTDRTPEIINEMGKIRLISHRMNRGYGAALITGIRNSSGEYIIWYDGDGQHEPNDLVSLFDKLVDDNLDYCIGVRDSHSYRVANRQLGKLVLKIFVNFAAGEKVADFNSGLRGFRRKVILQYLHLFPKGFSASTTTTLILKERGYIGGEIPIVVKKTGWKKQRQSTKRRNKDRDGYHPVNVVVQANVVLWHNWNDIHPDRINIRFY